MRAVMGSVASEFKQLPRKIDDLYLDDIDMNGLLWWYSAAKKMHRAAKEIALGGKK